MMKSAEKAVHHLAAVLGVIAASAIVVMMFATVTDVVYRWFTSSSVPSLTEIAETALVASIFLGLGWTAVVGGHVSMSLVTDSLPERVAKVVNFLTWTICTAISGWLLYALTMRAISSTNASETRMGFVQWPIWPTRWFMVAGVACLLLACAMNWVKSMKGEEPMGGYKDEVAEAVEGAL